MSERKTETVVENENKKMLEQVTRDFLADSDIDYSRLEKQLCLIAKSICSNNERNLTDVNILCEKIFEKLLNRLYDLELSPVSYDGPCNYPAVDLIDSKNKIAVQVTSRTDREKITATIEKFNKLNRDKFNNELDELYVLTLSDKKVKYKEDGKAKIKNGKIFLFRDNVLDFSKLLEEIKKKSTYDKKIVVEIYDILNMLFDSGELECIFVEKTTEQFMRAQVSETYDIKSWAKGKGDVYMQAYLPTSYKKQMGCVVEFRKRDISGIMVTIDQEILLRDYFVSETEFKKKHSVGGYDSEDNVIIKMEDIRFAVNRHTANHMYELFSELNEYYTKEMEKINMIMGTSGLREVNGEYFMTTVDRYTWETIILFARAHNYFNDSGDREWNIFNDNVTYRGFILSPNAYSNINADIFCEISASENPLGGIDLFWRPGWKAGIGDMEKFDNVVKWKADYTRDWIENKLIAMARVYGR